MGINGEQCFYLLCIASFIKIGLLFTSVQDYWPSRTEYDDNHLAPLYLYYLINSQPDSGWVLSAVMQCWPAQWSLDIHHSVSFWVNSMTTAIHRRAAKDQCDLRPSLTDSVIWKYQTWPTCDWLNSLLKRNGFCCL